MVVGGFFCPDPPRIPGKKDRAGSTTSGEAGNARRSTTGRRATNDHAGLGAGELRSRAPAPSCNRRAGGGLYPTGGRGARGNTPATLRRGNRDALTLPKTPFPPYRLGACRGEGKREAPPRRRLTKERANTKSKGVASLVRSLVF